MPALVAGGCRVVAWFSRKPKDEAARKKDEELRKRIPITAYCLTGRTAAQQLQRHKTGHAKLVALRNVDLPAAIIS